MATAARRLVPFHLRPASARPLAAAAAGPHSRKRDAVSCKSTGKTRAKNKAKDTTMWRPQRRELEEHLKRRTRSAGAFDPGLYRRPSHSHHVPVLLGEMMEAHPEMELHVGMDVDPSALEIGQRHIEAFLASRATEEGGEDALQGTLRAYTHVKNFKYIKHVLGGVDESLADGSSGVDGILIDLGMSSMQVNRSDRGFSVLNDGPLDMRMDPKATLTAEDILNSWPELEVGRILRDYGEESNWQSLQRRIVKERKTGGLHSTGELVKLIQRTCTISGAPDGRLAVISFHSLEDRIVKQTFLELISGDEADDDDEDLACADIDNEDEPWFKQRVQGTNGTVLTKRPITPSQEEEKLNQRCRSAKLRVIQKA
uniref:Uncharacterized protein n=1 Tax=Aegilops tauschii TaxID=37682 RepID=R7WGH0_AEGTA